MKLGKAPITQAWIGFTFDPSSQKRAWDYNVAREFLFQYREEFTHVDAIFDETVQIQEISSTHQKVNERTVELDRIRARDEGETRWLQLSDDRLVFNITQRGSEYPGYPYLRNEAIVKLSDYVAHFRARAVRHAELHYVDLIEIPKPADGKIDLKDYFNLRVEMPENYGTTFHFSVRVLLQPDVPGDMLEVRIRSELPKLDAETFLFRMDWNMVCANIATIDNFVIHNRLDKAHNCLFDYFRASVTDRTWALFEPYEEG